VFADHRKNSQEGPYFASARRLDFQLVVRLTFRLGYHHHEHRQDTEYFAATLLETAARTIGSVAYFGTFARALQQLSRERHGVSHRPFASPSYACTRGPAHVPHARERAASCYQRDGSPLALVVAVVGAPRSSFPPRKRRSVGGAGPSGVRL